MTYTYPVVSVIVPVYNSELYLEECLNSIVHQTYRSIEIILINDGSTDSSHEIMNNYSMRDDRIVVLSQSNMGVSAARNAGLNIAKGEYILFVDSDDTIRNDAVEILYRQSILMNMDIVIGNVYFCHPNGKQIPRYQYVTELSKQSPLSGEQCFLQLCKTNNFPPLVYLYFTKLAIIREHKLFFEEGIVHEDELWCVKTLIYASKVSVVDIFHCFHRLRKGSIMQSDNRKYRVYSCIKVVKALEAFAAELQEKQVFVKAVGYVYVRIFCIYISICQLLHEMNKDTNEYKEYFMQLLKKIDPALSSFQKVLCSNYFNYGNKHFFPKSNCHHVMIYPVVSVIVPVYNSEPYLKDCLNSIVHQTYQSIEIILINDGSTDRSQEIMNSYSMKDKRIVLLSQSNRGVSAARNAGLSIAAGEYVLFVDSDDTIRNDAVEILCRQAILTDAEIVMGNIYFCYPDGRQNPCYQRIIELNKHPLLSGEECFSQLTEAYIFPPLVCLYFTKLSFIRKHQLLFEEGIIHEDELWCVKTLIYASKVSVMDFFHYFYRIREGSIMRSDNKKYRVNSFFKVVKALEEFAAELQEKQEFTKSVGYIYFRIFCIYRLSICQLLLEMKDSTNEYKEYFGKLLKKIYPTLSRPQQKACYTLFRKGNRLLFGLTLSFCITCRNEFLQIKQTFPKNLEDNRESKNIIEFILVDFGSTDGLREWVVENFMNEINDGYLKYYYTEELQTWHTSIAKNTSHKLANNDIVVSLNCKNFTGKNGGQIVIDYMTKYGCDKMILHQSGNEYGNGSYGRIALSKNNFLKLGGYDESFEPAGYQDEDLLLRAQQMGLSCIDLTDTRFCSTIINPNEEKTVDTSSNLSWKEMIEHNFQLSAKIITDENIKANMDKDHIGIVDNIYTL